MSQRLHTESHGRRGIVPLATALILVGVILAAALIVLLLAFLGGEEGAGSPNGTVGGGALTAVHRDGSARSD